MKSVRKHVSKKPSRRSALSSIEPSALAGNGSVCLDRDERVGELKLQLAQLKLQQQTAENQASHYAELFNGAPVGYLVLNLAGVILEINEAAAALLRQKPQEIKGRPLTLFLAKDDAPILLDHLSRCRPAKKPAVTELTLQPAESACVPVELVSAASLGADHTLHCRTMMVDISERKRVEEARLDSDRNYRNLVNSIEGIVWEGAQQLGVFTFVSGQTQQILGYPSERFLREPEFWEHRIHSADRERVLIARRQAIAERRGYVVEFRMLDSSRHVVWLRDTANVVLDSHGHACLQGVMVNITELKQAEEALRGETRMLETINRIGTLLTGQLNLDILVEKVVEAGRQVTGAKYGAFFYKRPKRVKDEPALYITPGASREIFEQLPLPHHSPGKPPTEMEHEAIRIDDLQLDLRTRPMLRTGGWHGELMHSYLALPVVSRSNEVMGALLFVHPLPGVFSERSQHLLAGIGAEAGIALDNARLYQAVSQNESHFRQLADAMPQIVWIAHADGCIYYFNRRWHEYTGQTVEGSVGYGWQQMLHPEDHEHGVEVWRNALATGNPFEVESRLREHRTGLYRWHLIRAVAIRSDEGQIVSWFGTSTDIEDQKRVESDVRDLNTALEKRVAERTAQLQASNKELEAFSYSVSHDLRAPLRSIDAFSQLVREDYQDKLDDQGREYLDIVSKASQQMSRLIDDLLHLSRVTRSEMRRGPVDLTALAQNIIAGWRKLEPQRQVEIVIAPDLKAQGDSQLIRVVLENLLNNAWKFTSRKPDARIELESEVQDGQRVFFVRDNGAGFDMTYANKLFGAFQRLHSSSDFPGHGIGLATVQRIINRHGGHIWAKAAVDQGATLYFTLPEQG